MAQDDRNRDRLAARGVANSEIVDSLRATTGEIHQQIERIEDARDGPAGATSIRVTRHGGAAEAR
jgi:hypothetical protein